MQTKQNLITPPKLRGYSYSVEEVIAAREAGQLLCMRLDTNYNCNLTCRYCYSYSDSKVKMAPMPFEEVKGIIDQACELGLRSIVYLGGGEPTLYPDFWPLMEYMAEKNIIPVIFTNAMLIDLEAAKRLYDLGASVIVKFDGSKEVQDYLTGEGTYERIRAGFDALIEAGLAGDHGNNYTRLGAAPCMCTANYDEMVDQWRYLRENFIFPNFERATTIGNATEDLSLSTEQVDKLINRLIEVDREEFGMEWELPYSSIPCHNCYVSLVGCHVTATGEVAICPEMPPVASLKDKSLAEILTESPFKEVRQIEEFIEEPCRSCEYLKQCFGGCRSKAFYDQDSLGAADPYCTVYRKK